MKQTIPPMEVGMSVLGESVMTRVAGVRKIAVLRANSVGDFIFILPALSALKAAYPEAEIVLLGRRWHAEFLRGRPGPVDRVVVVPYCAWIYEEPFESPQEGAFEAFVQAMREEAFDLAFQMFGGGRHSNTFIKELGARVSIGSQAADALALDRTIPYQRFQREVLRYLELAALAGATALDPRPRLSVMESDWQEAQAFAPGDAPYIVVHPGANDPRRRWSTAKFARVADVCARRGYHVLINGTAQEKELVLKVQGQMEERATAITEGLSLSGLLGLLSRSRLLLSNDSGPLHMAAAIDRPSVSLFWCGNYMTSAPSTCREHLVLLSWRLDCPVCGCNCLHEACPHKESFVDDIAEDEVLAACEALLPPRSRMALV